MVSFHHGQAEFENVNILQMAKDQTIILSQVFCRLVDSLEFEDAAYREVF